MIILLADDHRLFLESMRCWITGERDWEVVTATSHQAVCEQLNQGLRPDIVILDMNMHGQDGVEAIRTLHAGWPDLPVLIVSANEDPAAIRACLEAGAMGFVPKSADGDCLIRAIEKVALNGQQVIPEGLSPALMPQLSRKQWEILHCLAEGLSNQQIAERVHLTEGTVKQYISHILAELNVDNRVQAGLRARAIFGMND